MTDRFELEKIIKVNGYTKKQVAALLNLTEQGFNRKVKGDTEFKASEIKKLIDLLNCDVNIFFANTVE